MNGAEGLMQLFPMERRGFWQETAEQFRGLQEIRMRSAKPVLLIIDGREYFLEKNGTVTVNRASAYCATGEELEKLLQHICNYSLYAYADELRQGFITVAGGHRVGVVGQVVSEQDGTIRTIKNISGINIRISHEIPGAANQVLCRLYSRGELQNVLIISPPGCGKTTLLRDIIRQVSDGNAYGRGMCVGVVDERSEIAGTYQGQAQNDVGMRTDVLDACPKVQGMMLLLRSMSPGVIAIDELGGAEDMQALKTAACCGSKIVATVHGGDVRDALIRMEGEGGNPLQLFDCFIILGREQGQPVVKEIMGRKEVYAAIGRRNYDNRRLSGTGHLVQEPVSTAASGSWYPIGDFGNAEK